MNLIINLEPFYMMCTQRETYYFFGNLIKAHGQILFSVIGGK